MDGFFCIPPVSHEPPCPMNTGVHTTLDSLFLQECICPSKPLPNERPLSGRSDCHSGVHRARVGMFQSWGDTSSPQSAYCCPPRLPPLPAFHPTTLVGVRSLASFLSSCRDPVTPVCCSPLPHAPRCPDRRSIETEGC